MKIRAELTVNGETRRPYLVGGTNETDDHVIHKLAAYILFWKDDPTPDATAKMPGLADYEFMPDLVAFDDGGRVKLWVEVDSVTMNQLTKVTRREPTARLFVLKKNPREAQLLRRELDARFDRPERVTVLAWPEGAYKEWAALIGEKVEGFGEADERSLNLVIGETMVVVDFLSY